MHKLRGFIGSLDDDERQAFAALLAPGVHEAWTEPSEVEGFVDWRPSSLPEHLTEAVRNSGIQISGWQQDEPDQEP